MAKPKTKREEGFNLAFLDVMACGLGAVLLILILVKFNEITPEPPDDVELLREQLQAALEENQQIEAQIGQLTGASVQSQSQTEQSEQAIRERIAQLEATKKTVMAEIKRVSGLKKEPLPTPPPPPEPPKDRVNLAGQGEEDYLLGLKVEGRHIGILLDVSGSMVHESLPRAILAKGRSASQKRAMPKWQRTLRVAKWMLARAPQSSTVSLVAFSDSAQVMGGRDVHTVRIEGSMQRLSQSLNSLTPGNGTNLMTGLKAIRKAMPNMTDLYVITDGLPTLVESSVQIRGCTGVKNVSGACRAQIFDATLKQAWRFGPKVNVVLLPLEGEVEAPFLYWVWAGRSRGTMISPAGSWP